MSFEQLVGGFATSEIAVVSAFFIGLMMAVSPCPLATNIAAMAYLSRNLESAHKIIISGLLYTFGRTVVYMFLAMLIVYFGINMMDMSLLLQSNYHILLGPSLLIFGVIMLEWVSFSGFGIGGRKVENIKKQLAKQGFIGSFLLGVLFALAFCPFSAVLFFGMLIPLAIANSDSLFIPASFSFATALPVVFVAFALSSGANAVGKHIGKFQFIEQSVRRFAGMVFVLAGIYYTIQIFL